MQKHPLQKLKLRFNGLYRQHPRYLAVLALVFSSVSLAIFLNACSSTGGTTLSPPVVPGAVFVGNKACVDCHAGIVQKFPTSPHARLHFAPDPKSGPSGCESCHGPGSLHIQAGGGKKYILNPGKDSASCFQCHLETHAEFNLPQHHPVVEGRMNCVQCHDPHGSDIMKPATGLAMARLNESCANCHRQQTRPFVFEHEAMRDGCAVCHNPHGSINRKLLVQNDPNLCLRCHAQVQDPTLGSGVILIGGFDHTPFLNRATCWTAGCHTAVHGSNVDPWLRY